MARSTKNRTVFLIKIGKSLSGSHTDAVESCFIGQSSTNEMNTLLSVLHQAVSPDDHNYKEIIVTYETKETNYFEIKDLLFDFVMSLVLSKKPLPRLYKGQELCFVDNHGNKLRLYHIVSSEESSPVIVFSNGVLNQTKLWSRGTHDLYSLRKELIEEISKITKTLNQDKKYREDYLFIFKNDDELFLDYSHSRMLGLASERITAENVGDEKQMVFKNEDEPDKVLVVRRLE